MQITTIHVEIHEKKSHPHEYGHFDAKCAMSASLEEGEDAQAAAEGVRALCRAHVQSELDRWIEDVEAERHVEQAMLNIREVGRGWDTDGHYKEARKLIDRLPARWEEKANRLRAALDLAWNGALQERPAEADSQPGDNDPLLGEEWNEEEEETGF